VASPSLSKKATSFPKPAFEAFSFLLGKNIPVLSFLGLVGGPRFSRLGSIESRSLCDREADGRSLLP